MVTTEPVGAVPGAMVMLLLYVNGIESPLLPSLSGSRLLTVPPGVVTVTAKPVAPPRGPVVAVKLPPLAATLMLVSATPPILAESCPEMNPVPLTVIVCPPAAGPLVGAIVVIVGRATTV